MQTGCRQVLVTQDEWNLWYDLCLQTGSLWSETQLDIENSSEPLIIISHPVIDRTVETELNKC